jgi:hypothetical protein
MMRPGEHRIVTKRLQEIFNLNYARNETRRTGSLTSGAAAPWAGLNPL